ncbi:2-hydroxychromene-2-carboxylate isomerase [Lacisediminimonas profundi]|uniref:2-hydroxychromene-2-carboxylate isomerase n=1 Tax=Lacisediminimonas profundi TaxID=2603856 RepID=UPI00124BAD80|nr:2-hydroxychromene-2-carboxylate isomerase [Lacisediminimonas profundi]
MERIEKVDFYFDFLSPFAYLGHVRLCRMSARHGFRIAYHPIDLMQAKKAIGNIGPGNRDMPVKLGYINEDLQRWARRYDVPLKFVQNFNTRILNTGLLFCSDDAVQRRYVQVAYNLSWGQGGTPDSPELHAGLAQEMGWDVREFLGFVQSDAAAAAYQSSTDDAIARKVFGVPTMMIGELMWWGNDRLDFVEEYVASGKN